MSEVYEELSDEVKEAIAAPNPEPEPRTRQSLIEEAYSNKLAAEKAENDDEREQFLAQEQICLKAAEGASA